MNNFTLKIIIALFILYIVSQNINQKDVDTNTPTPIPVVVPKPSIPVQKIIYDNIELAKENAKKYNCQLLLIFSADWCGYCKRLKKEINNIQGFNDRIVCVIDTDKNGKLAEEYKIRGLPTSILLKDNTELSRKMGFVKDDYENWLNENKK